MEAYEVLERALGLIEREENWCQHILHRADEGSYCATGALNVAASGSPWPSPLEDLPAPTIHAYKAAILVLERMAERMGFEREGYLFTVGVQPALAVFNNAASHAEVVALFQTAIRAEKQKAGIPLDLPASVPSHPLDKRGVVAR